MLRSTLVVSVMAILIIGCQTGPLALDQAATMVAGTVAAAPSTQTSLPTSTSIPTQTPASRPTVTANAALTTTVEAFEVLSELDVHVGANAGVPYEAGTLLWRQTAPVTLEMSGPQKDAGILQGIGENLDVTNFVFKSNVTWNASGVLICGLAFRAEPDLNRGQQYQFYFYRLSGLPAYKIDVYEFGRFKSTISDTRFSDGINSNNDATNEFVLIVQNEQFTVLINGRRQGPFFDSGKLRQEGSLAFLAWQDSGQGSCRFENSWLWALP